MNKQSNNSDGEKRVNTILSEQTVSLMSVMTLHALVTLPLFHTVATRIAMSLLPRRECYWDIVGSTLPQLDFAGDNIKWRCFCSSSICLVCGYFIIPQQPFSDLLPKPRHKYGIQTNRNSNVTVTMNLWGLRWADASYRSRRRSPVVGFDGEWRRRKEIRKLVCCGKFWMSPVQGV